MIKQFKQLDVNDLKMNAVVSPSKSQYFGAKLSLTLSSVVLLLLSGSASAACKGLDCVCLPSEIQFSSPLMEADADGDYPISLEADNVESQGEDVVTLTGNAEVTQGRRTVVADKLQYYRQSERVVAQGGVEMISDGGDYLASESIDIHVPTQIGTLNNSQFKFARGLSSADGVDTVQIESRGSAELVSLEGDGFIRLENADYSTCPEGNDSVVIGARTLELDRTGGVGRAHGATIRFKGLPIFYAPYISFPLNDKRKTGLLAPSYGSDQESGNIFEVPWYWNIAKNQDATITPRYFTDRGLQVGAEYRRQTENSSTLIYAEVLADDKLFGDDRDLLSIQHSQQLTDNLSARINYNDVSDIDYFNDLRSDTRSFSTTFVPRDIQLNYSHQYFRLRARANEYQIIDDRVSSARAPYERLPSLTFSTNLPDGLYDSSYGVNASYTDFSSDSRIEGTRTSINPYVELPFETLWGYVKPKVSVYSSSYSLDNVADGAEDSPSFVVPVFSVDSGLYYEKNSSWFGNDALQTLEPRLFYAYAPEEDQSDVPVFDTSAVSLNNFSNIFRENRFYGSDRVGDTNQITLGLTTRFIDNETGNQMLTASIGQLYLLDDLEQNLSTSTVIEKGLGDLLAEVKTESKGAWTTYSFVQYDHDESEVRTARFAVGYEPKDDSRKNVQFGYYRSDVRNRVVDQLTLEANWPVSDKWQFFGSERYSIEDSESIETRAGLEYNGCCWKLRFIGSSRIDTRLRRTSDIDGDDKRTAFFIELELTALGRLRTGL
ncbi:MAG: LPS-assembly protein [Arenicella sp.]|jgi:LPS-assembly protein